MICLFFQSASCHCKLFVDVVLITGDRLGCLLRYVNNGLYLVGLDHRSREIRVFAVQRIDFASATNHRFEISESFNFDEFTGSAFQMVWGGPKHVAIRFTADQAPCVTERAWHSSQKVTSQDEGSAVLEMDVADLDKVKRWLLGFILTGLSPPTRSFGRRCWVGHAANDAKINLKIIFHIAPAPDQALACPRNEVPRLRANAFWPRPRCS